MNKISAQFGVSVANLQAWNNISGSLIFAGQKIIVKKAPTQVQRIRTSLRIMVAVRQHPTIKSGDTLNKISAQFGVSVANLRSWNGIKGDLIFAGQTIIVKKALLQVAMLLQQIVHQANAIQLKAVIHFGAYQCNTESASKNQTIKWLKRGYNLYWSNFKSWLI